MRCGAWQVVGLVDTEGTPRGRQLRRQGARWSECANARSSRVATLRTAADRQLVEADRDHAAGVRAQVGRLMGGEARAVGAGQVEGVGVVLDVVLLVEGLPEPGSEVAAGRDAVRAVGCEGCRSLGGACYPELVPVREVGDVEDL